MSSDFEDIEDEAPAQTSIMSSIIHHSDNDGFDDVGDEEQGFDDVNHKEELEEISQPPAQENDNRFIRELEFVQCLSNPRYLVFLAGQNYFNDPCFIRYLKYLLYWDTPKYSHYIRYPQTLFYLHMLQKKEFRDFIANPNNMMVNDIQSYLYWQYYMAHRIDQTLPSEEQIGFKTLIKAPEPQKKKKKKKSKHHDNKPKEEVKTDPIL